MVIRAVLWVFKIKSVGANKLKYKEEIIGCEHWEGRDWVVIRPDIYNQWYLMCSFHQNSA